MIKDNYEQLTNWEHVPYSRVFDLMEHFDATQNATKSQKEEKNRYLVILGTFNSFGIYKNV